MQNSVTSNQGSTGPQHRHTRWLCRVHRPPPTAGPGARYHLPHQAGLPPPGNRRTLAQALLGIGAQIGAVQDSSSDDQSVRAHARSIARWYLLPLSEPAIRSVTSRYTRARSNSCPK